jgi:hypothetical protein
MKAVDRDILGSADEVAGRVVHEQIQRTAGSPDLVDHGIDVAGRSNIERMNRNMPAMLGQPFRSFFEHSGPSTTDVNLCPQLGESIRHRQPEASAAPGDDHALSCKQILGEHRSSSFFR